MTTFKDLVNEVENQLYGYTMNQDAATYLTAAIGSDDLTIQVASVDNISKGIIEIDDELMFVDSFDKTSKTIVIAPFGRGFRGTTKSTHGINSRVTISPSYPRNTIKSNINNVIKSFYPRLFGVQVTTFTYNAAHNTYALPDNVENILSISFEMIGPTKEWAPVKRWDIDKNADVPSFSSSKTVTIGSPLPTGCSVKVVYSMRPEKLNFDTDEFEYITGLSDSATDLVTLGACYRMVAFSEAGRGAFTSAEADLQSSRIQYGSVSNTSKYIYALYQQRLQEEIESLRDRFPTRVHYTGR
jgi:hypothetical protein